MCIRDSIAIERYDDGIIKMFIDGNDNNTGTLDLAADIYSGYNLLVGSRHYNRFHSCTISEVIVSRQNTYFGSFSPPQSFTTNANTVMHLQMNEGSGSTLNDVSGNGNNGTIYGATWFEDVPNPPTPPVPGGNNSLVLMELMTTLKFKIKLQ